MSLDYDAYVFHTTVPKGYYHFLHKLKEMGKKIVWSIDDDVENLPDWNPAKHYLDQNFIRWLKDNADETWVSTDYLAGIIGKGRVLPNLVDHRLWPAIQHKPKNEKVRVVWAGSAYHEPDLNIVGYLFQNLINEFDVQCFFFGSWPSHCSQAVRIPGSNSCQLVPQDYFAGRIGYVNPVDVRQYPFTLASLNPDIGVCALADEPFAYSKSNLKFLEYSMCECPTVATDLPPYQNTAALLGDLYSRCVELINDEELRVGLGQHSYDHVRSNYCWDMEKKNLWLDAFRSLA